MIKLETTSAAPQAATMISVQSVGDSPSIVLSTTDAWKPQDDDWLRDDAKRKQLMTFINAEGRTCEIVGAVPEAHAVEIAAAWKVVAVASLRTDKKTGQIRLAVERVVEVWTAPGKCLWRAKEHEQKAVGASMDASGRITKAA